MNRSHARPKLLLAVKEHDKVLFFSSPQPQNPDANSSSPVLSASELTYFPFDAQCEISCPVNGWICLIDMRISNVNVETVPLICNPTTGQSLTLPKLKLRANGKSYFGYDPIHKHFKVLCMSSIDDSVYWVFDEYQILTIGGSGQNLSWRMIQCCIPSHRSFGKGICINGVLYYPASNHIFSNLSMIVCFDFRSEEFNVITIPEDSRRLVSKGNLINYNGKLGSVVCDRYGYFDGRNGRRGSIELWILEDAEKMEWSSRTYVMPVMWQNILGINRLRFLGVTKANEIVFSTMERMPFCVIYYNIERNTITKVKIQGMEGFKDTPFYKFLDHVEDVNLM